jgi:TPR repeat protein
MKSFNFKTKNDFIKKRIQQVQSDPILNNFFPGYIFNDNKIDYLKNILDKFIDRYYSKVFDIRNPKEPKEKIDPKLNKGRCELVISDSFKKLFDFNISISNDGNIIHRYLFINLLTIFFLDYKVSFTNYNNNFNEINFDKQNDIGILILTSDHVCCLFNCNGSLKYYNDNDKQIYDWEKGSCVKQIDDIKSKVLYLTVISKHTQDNNFDIDIKNLLNLTNLDTINNVELQYYLAKMYYNGQGVSQDYSKAAHYYKLSADQGDADAQNNLALMYYYERGVKQDYKEASKYYKLAADQGNAQAQNSLALMYDNGQGVDQNYEEAVKYYQLSADQGNALAQNNLASMYENGQGIKQDYEEAERYYKLAADQGNALAQYNLASIYEVKQNYLDAIHYYKLAAEQDDTDALMNLERIKI